jgi:hypoxanthine phosphoribosyltransferase
VKLLYSKKKILSRVKELGEQITKDNIDNNMIIVPILKGAVMFACDLIRQIDVPIQIDFIRLSSYSGQDSSGKLQFGYLGDLDWFGKDILIVEDIIDTGLTLNTLIEYLNRTKQPKSIKVCALIDKYSRRKLEAKADYVGFKLEKDLFVIGYGLDNSEYDRNLDSIYCL